MHDHASWSLGFGRWGGVHVRVHMFFVLFAAFTCYLSLRDGSDAGSPKGDGLAFYSLSILLVSVLLHELGHLWAARRLGGRLDEIVLAPWGGVTMVQGVADPRAELLAHVAGPAANVAVCLLSAPLLAGPWGQLSGLLNPLFPDGLTDGTMVVKLVKLAFWTNWTLLLLNLLPVFPFDGGAVFRAALLIKWPELGRRGASWLVASLARVAVLGAAVLAFFLPYDDSVGPVPLRFALILLCIFLYFSAQHEERLSAAGGAEEDEPFADSRPPASLASLERSIEQRGDATGPLQRWIDRRRELRLRRQQALEAEEERCVDEILERLHEHGMQALSPEDRALLDRVSARYRSRLSR